MPPVAVPQPVVTVPPQEAPPQNQPQQGGAAEVPHHPQPVVTVPPVNPPPVLNTNGAQATPEQIAAAAYQQQQTAGLATQQQQATLNHNQVPLNQIGQPGTQVIQQQGQSSQEPADEDYGVDLSLIHI